MNKTILVLILILNEQFIVENEWTRVLNQANADLKTMIQIEMEDIDHYNNNNAITPKDKFIPV